MQDGNPGQDPVCGRCKQKIEMAGRTEAVYQDGIWFHTACHRAGADQLFRAMRLSEVLEEAKRGVETITSPLFQGDDPPGAYADEGEERSSCLRLQSWSPVTAEMSKHDEALFR